MITPRSIGRPRGRRVGGVASGEARQAEADRRSKGLEPALLEARRSGCASPAEIAAHFNQRGVPARRGGRWSRAMVRALIERLELLNAD